MIQSTDWFNLSHFVSRYWELNQLDHVIQSLGYYRSVQPDDAGNSRCFHSAFYQEV